METHLQRNDTIHKWIKEQNFNPVEELAAWKMYRFCCNIEPRLRGKVIGYSKEVNKYGLIKID